MLLPRVVAEDCGEGVLWLLRLVLLGLSSSPVTAEARCHARAEGGAAWRGHCLPSGCNRCLRLQHRSVGNLRAAAARALVEARARGVRPRGGVPHPAVEAIGDTHADANTVRAIAAERTGSKVHEAGAEASSSSPTLAAAGGHRRGRVEEIGPSAGVWVTVGAAPAPLLRRGPQRVAVGAHRGVVVLERRRRRPTAVPRPVD